MNLTNVENRRTATPPPKRRPSAIAAGVPTVIDLPRTG
jgi:hypothetical protein